MDHEFATFGHGFDGVFYEVDQSCLERGAIESYVGQIGIEEFADVNILFVRLGLKEIQYGLDLVV